MEEETSNVQSIGVYTKNEVIEELVALVDCSTIGAPDCGKHGSYSLLGKYNGNRKKIIAS